jgi:NDP-sugar pyrophosphorylase family protein
MTRNCKFFILAGGYGKRAQPLSLIKPKPLFPLAGTPIIKILLTQLHKQGLGEGFINLHYMQEMLRRTVAETTRTTGSPTVRFLAEKQLSGSRILRKAARYMTDEDRLLVVNGDIFLEIPAAELQDQMHGSGADGILLVRKNKEKDPQYKILLTANDLFCGRKRWNKNEIEPGAEPLMYTGVALFKRSVIRAIAGTNFFDVLERENFKIKVMEYNGIWLDSGEPRTYMQANFAYQAYLNRDNSDSNCLSANVVISADSQVEHSVIWENTRIINHSVLKNCLVTGNTSLDNVCCQNKIIIRGSIAGGIVL